MNAVKEGRIANRECQVIMWEKESMNFFVRDGKEELVKRKVELGDSNFEYVEVVSGLQPGDHVVVSDMKEYKNKHKINLKH